MFFNQKSKSNFLLLSPTISARCTFPFSSSGMVATRNHGIGVKTQIGLLVLFSAENDSVASLSGFFFGILLDFLSYFFIQNQSFFRFSKDNISSHFWIQKTRGSKNGVHIVLYIYLSKLAIVRCDFSTDDLLVASFAF